MADPVVYGFTRSTFVNIVRMVLTHKEVPYTFRDLQTLAACCAAGVVLYLAGALT